ncbi:heme exporter protein C [Sodalis glossinidius str. 'morsitans']|uniref:Heme exporter protein C n=1 Tax=Sodalis glossinidius (strain morsitans) TaxID=343509 RepID=Q2NSG4_SODGM|nr:cytochrome c biogenesis protein CcsA [Sodalis glossinidius]BAE74911.1 heme exporter protein C [Sodalis glossinidius str. 'morsitans']
MLKVLHQWAKPERLYYICGRCIPWFAIAALFTLLLGWVWGFSFAPPDYQQGESVRIMYLHVPVAIWSMGIYVAMAPVFTLIALITGSAWGKPMWGTWWVWDARLTSELVLLFLYLGVMALHNAFDDRCTAGRAAGILILVAIVNIPIIHFSVQWWNTLHQGSTNMQQTIDPSMRTPLRWAIGGYLLFFITVTLILFQERKRPWAIALAQKERL